MQKVQGGCSFGDPLAQSVSPCLQLLPLRLSPGEPSQRKGSPEGALQDQSPAKRVVRCALTGSEGTVEAVGVSSSAPVESGGAVAAERSPPVCEGELCGVSSPSVRLGWSRPCLSSLSPSPPSSMVFNALS